MYRTIEKSLFSSFKESNELLLKLSLVIIVLMQPVLIIIGAVPGYFFLSYEFLSIQFLFAVCFLSFLSFLSFKIYNHIFNPKYFYFSINVFGRKKFLFDYCVANLRFALPTWIILVLGAYRSEIVFESLFKIFVFVVFHCLFYFNFAHKYLRKDAFYKEGKYATLSLLKELLRPALFHFLFYFSVASVHVAMSIMLLNQHAKLLFSTFLMVLILFVVNSTRKIIKESFFNYSWFIKSIDIRLYKGINGVVDFSTGLMIVFPLLFCFF